ncbi:MAG: bZIP transcription factor, partial [Candidatus Korobacteraceae bacterium]
MSAAPESGAGETNQQLQQHVNQLESEVQELREQVKEMKAAMAPKPGSTNSDGAPHDTVDVQASSVAGSPGPLTAEDRSTLDFLKGTTINAMIDTYYEYNFNQPVGRVNVLRAYDVLS